MLSVETKEVATALGSLAKAKGKRQPQNVAVQPVATMVENRNTPVTATLETAPVTPATPAPTPVTVQAPAHDYEKRYKDLKSHYDTEVSSLRNENGQLKAELTKAPAVALPKTKEEMELYRKQYPEAMDVFQTLAIETVRNQSAELRETLEKVRSYQDELKGKEAFNQLLEIHPDAAKIKESPKFLEWFNEQPRAIQDILQNSSDVKAVAKQLTLYKLEVLGINPKEAKKQETQSAIEASLGVPVTTHTEITSQKKIWTQTEINAICADYKTWLKYRVELDDAARENRIDRSK